uniref:AB hydrolase-1 domain-containing protein n=1 Tax=Ananas comosus var. bracteatus TaxID=296719 RepID=A0A6V7PWR8_ANACO|nr:unnamed protein product [Ananas comosus var. bracteatus]
MTDRLICPIHVGEIGDGGRGARGERRGELRRLLPARRARPAALRALQGGRLRRRGRLAALLLLLLLVDVVAGGRRCRRRQDTGVGKGRRRGGPKVVSIFSARLELDDVSDTLYSRPSLLAELSRRLNLVAAPSARGGASVRAAAAPATMTATTTTTTTLTINSTIVQMLRGKIGGGGGGHASHPLPRWSDCDCVDCNAWCGPSGSPNTLFVHADVPKAAEEAVLFIHGFISSSAFWTETVFPNFSKETKSRYRLFAVDLLGFGRSPKPGDSLYTLREHVEMIERSVLEPHKVRSFHIVAHSLGSILALALAVKYPGAVKSLTLLAPPYFPVPKGEQGTQYVMRRVAPRRVWPVIAFGASVACWYEHVGRTVCLVLCKNHRLWELTFKLDVSDGRIFSPHPQCILAHSPQRHLRRCRQDRQLPGHREGPVRLHGDDIPREGRRAAAIDCSYAVQSKIPRARVKVVDRKDHITIVVGRQKAFARELEEIWKSTKS